MFKNILSILVASLIFFSCQNSTTSESEGGSKASPANTEKEQKEEGLISVKNTNPNLIGGKKKDIKTLMDRGIENVKANRYEEGLDYFNRVIEQDPDNPMAYYNRGYCYYSMKEYDKAVTEFDKAIELNPRDSVSYLYKGIIRYFQQDFQGSIELYNKALEIYPRYSLVFYNRGISKGQLKDYEGAIEDFNLCLNYDPDFPDALYNRGLAWYFSKNPQKACEDWKKAKALGLLEANEAVRIYCKE
jgi:tetratricopeptide (TPR) repeat protein